MVLFPSYRYWEAGVKAKWGTVTWQLTTIFSHQRISTGRRWVPSDYRGYRDAELPVFIRKILTSYGKNIKTRPQARTLSLSLPVWSLSIRSSTFTAWRNWSNLSQWSTYRFQTAFYSEYQRDPGAHVALRRRRTKILCSRILCWVKTHALETQSLGQTLSYSYTGAKQEPAHCASLQFLSPSEQTLHFTKSEQSWRGNIERMFPVCCRYEEERIKARKER